ncbi:MAG: hypothetical protein R3B13_16835 [Polyangiaceae bacterium]
MAVVLWLALLGCESASDREHARTAPVFHPITRVAANDGPLGEIVSEAFRELMALERSDLAVGEACGLGSGPPRGLIMVRYLLAARRVELLWQAYRSAPTAEGRVWGAYGLVQAGGTQQAALREFVASLDGAVWVCEGCLVFKVPAQSAVRYLPESA